VPARPNPFVLAGLLGALALCWVLLTPPGAGPDEPSHLYRAGELAEGHWDELLVTSLDPAIVTHELPAEYAVPEPACYFQQPTVSVDCAVGTKAEPAEPGRPVLVATTADNYPVWGHVPSAIATWLPGDGGIWAARIGSAAVAMALVAGAATMAARRSMLALTGVLVALTPMAWSTFAQVNPSAIATAGAVAVWVALATRQPGWLLAAGWAALALPRRDGLIWACLIAAAVTVVCGRGVLEQIWHDRRRLAGPLALIAVATLVTLVWDVTAAARIIRLGVLAPLAAAGGWAIRWGWDRLAGRGRLRAAYAAAVAAGGALGVAAAFVKRPGGWNRELSEAVVKETRRHLTEAIGVLGWLDTPLPRWATVGWVVLVGVLVVVAVRARARQALGLAAAAFGLAVVTMWVFELQEGSDYARYWQGRYSLPLLAGIPIALTTLRSPSNSVAGQVDEPTSSPATESGSPSVAGQLGDPATCPATESRVAWATGAGALLLVNVAAWAAARRWAVGINGTHRPWKWGAELFAVHPLPVLVAHAFVSGLIALLLFDPPGGRLISTTGPVGLRGRFAGVTATTSDDDGPFTTGERWKAE
jgi:hypothetical protein